MAVMVSMTRLAKTVSASVALGSLAFLAITGCTTTKTAQTTPQPDYAAPVAEPEPGKPKTLAETRTVPDGGLSPVAEPPQGAGSWGNSFMPPGN